MTTRIEDYKKGNLSIIEDQSTYYVLYKDELLYLNLSEIECINNKRKLNTDIEVIGKVYNDKVIDILNDIYYYCDTKLCLQKINLDSSTKKREKSFELYMYSGMSNSTYNIPHMGIFDADITISFSIIKQKLNYSNMICKPIHSIKMRIEEMQLRHKIYNLQEKSLVSIYNIDLGKITFQKGKNTPLYYNDQHLNMYIPPMSYTLFKNGKIGGNLVLTSSSDIINILRSIKQVVKIITKRDIKLETFVLSYDTNKTGDFMKFNNRSNFMASLICKLTLEDNLILYVSELQIEDTIVI